jgi:membrane-associated protease RseP (regulator of RpoE activity)
MAEALSRARTAPRLPVVNVALFFATVMTTLLAGAWSSSLPVPAATGSALAQALAEALAIATAGLPFATSLIGILFCHEMGHYLFARAYGVDSTLPYFIPMPFGPVGTFGAVIRIRSALPSRRATFDIGAAGPFAGLLVAVPLFAWGIAHSEVRPVGDALLEGSRSGAVDLVRSWLAGEPIAVGSGLELGDSVVTYLLQRLVVGELPAGTDVFLHPVARAAWFGLFVTTLNLIPLGQLDGGHVTYALLGRRRARAFSRFVSLALLAAGLFVCWTWLIWWAVTRFLVRLDHPSALDEAPLGPGRRALAIVALILFAVTFIPVPVSL